MTTELDPVSMVVRRRVRPGHEAAFEQLVSDLVRMLEQWPGHRGTGVIRPLPPSSEYLMVVRFDNVQVAAEWEDSPQRREWLARLEPHITGEVSIEQQPGLEFWFTPPGSPTLSQPRRWKMALITVLGLYPTSLIVALLIGPALAHLPLPLRSLLQALLIVPLMTYAVMPVATRVFGGWLKGR
ncbi:antibiotic biosynthesis monooxygenase [Deinococcus ruber]|uniref:Antibiotic biosynthesis monooxygenase n=1 Tax=Deinococcus ruber TaxID=1848197 RepID=A0A918BWV7_9DEIO|nr:antibiotic biosynthesis monooxygenase [Deinococcus ruber]GGQ96854.1 antibiotic biosynthesis monooxygenase [Deinococcus ruber]